MPEIMIEDYYSREQSGSDTEGDKIARGELHLLHACSALAASVTAALHGECQLICAAERRDKQRNEYRYKCLGALYKSACFKIRAFIMRSISSISTGIKRRASVIIMARVCTGTFITFKGESRRSKASVSIVGVVV